MGYHRAGFEVIGVDINPQPDYPFHFIQADAIEYMGRDQRELGRPLGHTMEWDFDAIHASPPCQLFSRAGRLRDAQGGKASSLDLLTPTLERFADLDIPWIVENVPGAPLDGIVLCGSSFGLKVRRHRVFASNVELTNLPCDHKGQGRPVGVYHVMGDSIPSGGRTAANLEEGQEAMGIDWMPWKSLKESIPPAYTEHLGTQIINHIKERQAA
jgi:DNA (cytosine-5)-methyltransferase 1